MKTKLILLLLLFPLLGMGQTSLASLLDEMPAEQLSRKDHLVEKILASGPKGISSLVSMLTPPGEGDDSEARYALESMARYVSANGREDQKKMFAGQIVNSLKTVSDTEMLIFLFERLLLTAGPAEIEGVSPYLTYTNLTDPAAAVLVNIGTPAAEAALISALDMALDDQKVSIAKALGQFSSDHAVAKLIEFSASDNSALQRAAFYSLGKSGSAKAYKTLYSAAVSQNFEYKPEGATSAFLSLGENALEAGNNGLAKKVAKMILKNTGSDHLLQRVKGVSLLLALPGAQANKILTKEYENSNSAYRKIILSRVADLPGSEVTTAWIAKANAAGPEHKAEIIAMLGRRKDKSVIPQLKAFLSEKDSDIKIAAIKSLVNLNAEGMLPEMINLFKSGDDAVPHLKQELARIVRLEDLPELYEAYYELGSNGKTTVVEMMGARGDIQALWSTLENSARQGVHATAISEIVKIANGWVLPEDQRLLMLRKAMESASTEKEKSEILSAAGRLSTFLAFMFVSEYLDDSEPGKTAARSAINIALPDGNREVGLFGVNVRENLTKAAKVLGDERQTGRVNEYLAAMSGDRGFVSMFNGKDLSGWKGYVDNPYKVAAMSAEELAEKQAEANIKMLDNWGVRDGTITFTGKGHNLLSVKDYGDFEMIVDWRITKEGDSGIYLRGTPQVQIWDTSRVEVGAQVGSGGLYNNKVGESKPLVLADNAIGDWNTFHITMVGEKVTVYLNGQLVVDNVPLENYWDRSKPIFPFGTIELQAHGTDLAFRDVYVREISSPDYSLTSEEKAEGFVSLFDGNSLNGWTGNKDGYVPGDGTITVNPDAGGGGNLYTEKEYSNFVLRFEFQLTPGANNGLGIHAPLTGDVAYQGKEIQILDNTAEKYADLKPYQYHGSVYGIIPAKRGFLNPVGEWNYEEIMVNGDKIKVILNGTTIVDGDMKEASKNGTMDGRDHPGLKRSKGHIGFLGHGSDLKFRNIRIKEL